MKGGDSATVGLLLNELKNLPDPFHAGQQELGFSSERFAPLEEVPPEEAEAEVGELIGAGAEKGGYWVDDSLGSNTPKRASAWRGSRKRQRVEDRLTGVHPYAEGKPVGSNASGQAPRILTGIRFGQLRHHAPKSSTIP